MRQPDPVAIQRRSLPLIALLLMTASAPCNALNIIRDAHNSLDSHGYLRTGFGNSKGGAEQAEFQAPGARSKYRLGNEANTNYEFAFDLRHRTPAIRRDAYLQLFYMVDDFKPHNERAKLAIRGYPQLYLNLAGLIAPGVNLWFGRRYYDRKDIHLIDHYWLNSGQGADFGGGIEGIPLFSGKLKLALFQTRDDKAVGQTAATRNAHGVLRDDKLDLRLADIAVNTGGRLTLWGDLSRRWRNRALGYASRGGYGLGLWHDQKNGDGVSNTLALLYRKGASLTQGDFNARPIREEQGYDLTRASVWEANDNLLIEWNGQLSMQWTAVWRKERFGVAGSRGDSLTWYSSGVRPIWYFTDHLNAAVELGVDFIDDAVHDRKGNLRKATLALQLAKARGYYARPVLRAFITRAAWSSAFRGLIGASPGNAPYGNRTNGWSAGMQVETWW